MTNLSLSQDELALIYRVVGERSRTLYRVGFYLATHFPILAFAVLGVARRDLVAIGLAFFGLLGMSLWRLLTELRYFPLYRSLCDKVLLHRHSVDFGSTKCRQTDGN